MRLPRRGPGSYGSFRVAANKTEVDYGFDRRISITGKRMTLVVADTSGLHARGVSVPGARRRTLVLVGNNTDGGLKRRNPFVLSRQRLRTRSKRNQPSDPADAAQPVHAG